MRTIDAPSSGRLVSDVAPIAKPPLGNTGGKITSGVKIDWLNVVLPSVHRADVTAALALSLGRATELPHGGHSYRGGFEFPSGARIYYSMDRTDCLVSLNGDSCDLLGVGKMMMFLEDWIRSLSGRVTRLDIAFDDCERIASMDQIHAAAEANQFTGFRTTDSHRPKKDGVLVGDSREFGKRGKAGSGRFLIAYDKNLESGGAINSIRWELRLFKECSHLAAWSLTEFSQAEDFALHLGKLLAGSIDFILRGSDRNISRAPRLEWWQRLRDRLGSISIKVDRFIPPLQSWLEYFKINAAPSLALVRILIDGAGMDFLPILTELLDESETRINWRTQAKRDLGLDLLFFNTGSHKAAFAA